MIEIKIIKFPIIITNFSERLLKLIFEEDNYKNGSSFSNRIYSEMNHFYKIKYCFDSLVHSRYLKIFTLLNGEIENFKKKGPKVPSPICTIP